MNLSDAIDKGLATLGWNAQHRFDGKRAQNVRVWCIENMKGGLVK